MNDLNLCELPWEPERYELHESSALSLELSRRDFFRVAGAGVVIWVFCPRPLKVYVVASEASRVPYPDG